MLFPNVFPAIRPEIKITEYIYPYWIAGFTEGEGCFYILITKSNAYTTGSKVQLKFKLTQHIRDEELLKSLVDYFGCGEYCISKGRDWGDFFRGKIFWYEWENLSILR